MSVVRVRCRCCLSDKLVESVQPLIIEILTIICITRVPQFDESTVKLCFQCRNFLKKVYSFRKDTKATNNTITDLREDVKPQVDFRLKEEVKIENDEVSVETVKIEVDFVPESTDNRSDSLNMCYIPTSEFNEVHSQSERCSNQNISSYLLNYNFGLGYKERYPNSQKDEMLNSINGKQLNHCELCNYIGCTNFELTLHIQNAHGIKGNNENKSAEQIVEGKQFKCKECPFIAKRLDKLKRHILVHNNEKPFACDLCTFKCKTKYGLKVHIYRRHSTGKSFVYNNNSQDMYSCDHCWFSTPMKSILAMHIQKHLTKMPEKVYKCAYCPYAASWPSDLKRHELMHTGEKPFSCSLCLFKSTTRYALKHHIDCVHSNEKTFVCDGCGADYKKKLNLIWHIRSQSCRKDLHKLACNQCLYRTDNKRSLRNHMKKHNGQKFPCSECSFVALYPSKLKKHLIVHTVEKPFLCNVCGFKTKTSYCLKRHVQGQHRIEHSPSG